MIIQPCKRHDTETWINPTPFILEANDLGIVHDTIDPNTKEVFNADELTSCLMDFPFIGKGIREGLLYKIYEIPEMNTSYSIFGKHGSDLRYIANQFIAKLNSSLQQFRAEAFAYLKDMEGWELACDICQNTVSRRIYDYELAAANENEVERRAIKLNRQMRRNGEIQ